MEAADVQLLFREIRRLTKKVEDLTAVVTKGKITDTWVSEEDAAALLGCCRRILRQKVTNEAHPRHIAIKFRNTHGRAYQYHRPGILEYLRQTTG